MVEPLLKGVAKFQRGYFRRNRERYAQLAKEGQNPGTLFITCADSRILPDQLTGADPGELFVLRNVGNMVPPPDPELADPGVGSAIEYAVSVLNVDQIIVCGHSHCGACAALYSGADGDDLPLTRKWLEQGSRVKDIILEKAGSSAETVDELFKSGHRCQEVLRATEKAMVVQHLQNLLRYPVVDKHVEAGRLLIHGWYYAIESGEIEYYDPERLAFVPLSGAEATAARQQAD
ncbi:MAG TPA: carbonic anhydrase [Burkholderiales bacterium]|nr:carbonic anhydrase [Burkholderiales bacterium]